MSGWNLTPPASNTAIAVWTWSIQFWWAIRERFRATGVEFWPPTNVVWSRGIVSGITDNGDGTLTIETTIPDTGWDIPSTCSSDNDPPSRWANVRCTDCQAQLIQPRYFDLIIEGDDRDPFTCVRGQITTNTGTDAGDSGTITFQGQPTLNAVVGKVIPDLSYLIGKPWYILKSAGLWQADRLPEKPNDPEEVAGPDALGVSIIEDSASSLSGYAGKTLRVGGIDYDILTTSGKQVLIAGQTTALSGAYQIKNGSTVLLSGTITACYSGIYQTTCPIRWPAGQFVDLELLAGSGGYLKRLTIVGNASQWLWFAQQAFVVSGDYSVVQVDSQGIPGRKKWNPFQWHTGTPQAWYTHNAIDAITPRAMMPQSAFKWDEGDPCVFPGADCATYSHTDPEFGKDFDYYAAFDNLCQSDEYFQRDLYKSWRSLQVCVLQLCGSFVPMASYDGASAIPNYTPATMYRDAGMAAESTTLFSTTGLGGGSGVATFSVDSFYYGYSLKYTVFGSDGSIKDGGGGIATATDGDLHPGGTYNFDTDPTDEGLAVVYSPGPKRVRINFLTGMTPRTVFIPDTAADDIGNVTAVDPPAVTPDEITGNYDCGGAGTFETRPAPTKFATYGDDGFLTDSGDEPNEGDLGLFIGDRFDSPGITPSTYYSADNTGASVVLLEYYDRFFRGRYADPIWRRRVGSLSGTGYAITADSLFDSSKNWWDDGVNHNTPLRGETGVATGGNSTTLLDTTKDTTDSSQPHGCWWAESRFNGTGAYLNFVREVSHTYTGSDLRIDSTDDRLVSSDSRVFIQADVGMSLTIATATGWTAGSYEIVGVDASGNATLASSPAPAGTSTQPDWSLTTTYYAPVTASTQGSGGISLSGAEIDGWGGPVSGDNYQVLEPAYTVNKWATYKVKLTAAGSGDKLTAIARINNQNRLWLSDIKDASDAAAALTPGVKYAYQIVDYPFGVYKFTGGKWVVATGADDVRLGVTEPLDFLKTPADNLPGMVIDYGLIRCMDVMQGGVFEGLYNCINKLRMIKWGMGWTPDSVPGTPENNARFYNVLPAIAPHFGSFSTDPAKNPAYYYYSSWDDAWDALWTAIFDPAGDPEATGSAGDDRRDVAPRRDTGFSVPYVWANYGAYNQNSNGDFGIGGDAVYAYGKVDTHGLPTDIPFTINGMVYGEIDGAGHTEGAEPTHRGDPADSSMGDVGTSWALYKFDDMGFPIQNKKWSTYATFAGTPNTIQIGPKMGTNEIGPKPEITIQEWDGRANTFGLGDDGTSYDGVSGTSGWRVTDQMALIVFDFEFQ